MANSLDTYFLDQAAPGAPPVAPESADNFFSPVDPDWKAPEGAPAPFFSDTFLPVKVDTPPPAPVDSSDYGWGIIQAFKRGTEMLTALPDVATGDTEELAEHFQRMEELGRSDEDNLKLQQIQETDGWWDTAVEIFKNPKLTMQVVAESLPNMLAPAVGGIIGGVGGGAAGTAAPVIGNVAGATIGTVVGAGLGSFATDYLHTLSGFLSENGVDMTNADELKAAFANEELMGRAKESAYKHGIPVGVFDGLSFGLAGKIYKIAKGAGKATRAAAAAGELGMQAGFGAGGEAGGQLWEKGKITDKSGVLFEGIAEIPGAVVEPVINKITGASKRAEADVEADADADALSRQLNAPLSDEDLLGGDAPLPPFDAGGGDALAKQIRDKGNVQLEIEALQQAEQARNEGFAAAEAASSERRTSIFMEAEAAHDGELLRQRQEAEYQKALQEGEAAKALPSVEDVAAEKQAKLDQQAEENRQIEKAKEPLPGTALGDALVEAKNKQLETVGQEVATAPLIEPVRSETSKPTKAINPDRDSFLTTRAKSPVNLRLSQKAFAEEGLDIDLLRKPVYGGNPAFSKHKDAMTPDAVAEYLNEQKYPNPEGGPWDANSALNAVTEELEGRTPLYTGNAIATAEAELAYGEEYSSYEQEVERRATHGAPKAWEITVDGVPAHVEENTTGDIEVRIGDNTTVTTRKKGESNADLVRAVMEANPDLKANIKAVVSESPEAAATPATSVAEKEEVTFDSLAADVRKVFPSLTVNSSENEKNAVAAVIRLLKKEGHAEADALQTELEAASKKTRPSNTETLGEQIATRDKLEKASKEKAAPDEEYVDDFDDSIPFGEPSKADEGIEAFDNAFADLDELKNEAATSPENDLTPPTEAQKKAGNYKKAHRKLAGLDVTIENPKGSDRRGVKQKDHYGYIKRTEGADGDQVDVFVNPKANEDFDGKVWVIDQTKEDGTTFDEHKVMLGYKNQMDAIRGYKRNYTTGWRVGPITEMTLEEFKAWLETDTTQSIAEQKQTQKKTQKKAAKQESKSKEKKPNKGARLSRRFSERGGKVRYSIRGHNSAILEDAQESLPGVSSEWVKQVLGQTPEDTASGNGIVTRILELQEQHERDKAAQEAQDKTAQEAQDKVDGYISKAEVEAAIAPMLEQLAMLDVTVHASVETMPETTAKEKKFKEIVQKAVADMGKHAGVYNTVTGEIHLFADGIHDADHAIGTVLHEGVAHHGLRVLFNGSTKAFHDLMLDVFKNASNREAIAELQSLYKQGTRNKTEWNSLIGEEYIAWMAETGKQPGLLKKVYAAIRKALRSIGIVREWTDNDINALLMETRTALKGLPISEISLTEEVQLEETGEIFDVEVNAEVMLRQHDKRVGIVEKLRACL